MSLPLIRYGGNESRRSFFNRAYAKKSEFGISSFFSLTRAQVKNGLNNRSIPTVVSGP
jgi:hypothetical protein